jgi:hypothetical protein
MTPVVVRRKDTRFAPTQVMLAELEMSKPSRALLPATMLFSKVIA